MCFLVWLSLFNSSLYQYSLSIILVSLSFSLSSPTLLHPPPVIFAFSILPLLCHTALLFLCHLFFALSSSFPVHCSSHLICVPSFTSVFFLPLNHFLALPPPLSIPLFWSFSLCPLSPSVAFFVTSWIPKACLPRDCSSCVIERRWS